MSAAENHIKDGVNDLKEFVSEVQDTFESSFDDVSENLHELKGILSETLGDLPFKCAVLVIVLFNLIYIFYDAFLSTRIHNVAASDCYCDPNDETFYRTIVLISVVFWICFLSVYALISTFGHGHFIRFNKAKENPLDANNASTFRKLFNLATKQEKSFRLILEDLVSAKVLDYDYCKGIEDYYTKLYSEKDSTNSEATRSANANAHGSKTESKTNQYKNPFQEFYQKDRKQPKRWWYYMCAKIGLIALRFIFRILIVPLLQLQWFNEYAWNCLMNNVIRNYCETETSKYFIGLDHTFVLYAVYVLLVIALLFSFIINWFPSGIPVVSFKYDGTRIIDILKHIQINIDKKRQFAYKRFENETTENDTTESLQNNATDSENLAK